MLEPVIKAFDLIKGDFNFRLHIIGPITNNELIKFIQKDYIIYHSSQTTEQVADFLRKSHIFIYSHLNPRCPNSVLEAISTGLPVIGFDSGAMAELCRFSKDLLAYVSDEIFQKYEDFKPEALAEKIMLCVKNYNYFREIALQNAYLYSFDDCGEKYVEVFNNVLRSHDQIILYNKKNSFLKSFIKQITRK
jgi:glycosyltransferase involved in cell wall biosynthesis